MIKPVNDDTVVEISHVSITTTTDDGTVSFDSSISRASLLHNVYN